MSYKSLCVLLALMTGTAAHAAKGPPLRLCYEDVDQRPWSTPSGKGLNFELLKRVETLLNEHFTYTPKPWKRCLSELKLGQVDGVIGAADAVSRRAWSRIPQLPDGREDPSRAMFEDTALVFLRVGGNARWDGHELQVPGKAVVVQSGYLVAQQLREKSYDPHETVKSAADALRMLAAGGFDAAILQGLEASKLAQEDARFKGRVQQAEQPFSTVNLHLMVARGAYERDPQRIEAIWQAIGSVRLSRDYRQLEEAAGVKHFH
ncbi:transporter substrate-binding domain-containing protein [Pseudoduganella eburnea]|uniref:Transporter substrate-binding domain-containing protein n=1 Tax=Massilia eburnea TaxID=1776165 RepID=A0A6L6QPV9_9BURK|nr:transporter substrate-binding domain-containing protein [Massilia eburnea]MTW13573.1 transporter substrate-binding domain-containing protein [Massilia eburnea]